MGEIKKSNEPVKIFRQNINDLLFSFTSFYSYHNLITLLKNKVEIKNKEINEILKEIIHKKEKQRDLFWNLCFINLITLMEVYLKEKLLEKINSKSEFLQTFLERFDINRKITIKDVYEGPEKLAHSLINELSFHNISKVNKIYEIVFGFRIYDFTKNNEIEKWIKIRHILVHHNGIYRGEKITISDIMFIKACHCVIEFIEGIDYFERHKAKRKKYPRMWKYYDKFQKLWDWDDYRDVAMTGIAEKMR